MVPAPMAIRRAAAADRSEWRRRLGFGKVVRVLCSWKRL